MDKIVWYKKWIFSKKGRSPFALFAVLLGVCLALASCSNFFQGKVDMPTSGTSSLVDFFKKETVGGTLPAPSKIYVDKYEFQDKIRISWEKVDNAAYYRLERAVVTEKKANGSFAEPKDEDYDVMDYTKSIYDTSYTDIIIDGKFSNELNYENVRYGYAYFYRVSAENPSAGYDASDFTKSSLAALFSPAANVNASMGKSEDKIDVTWDSVDGASSYEIYRTRESNGSNLKRIGSTPRNAYSDTVEAAYSGKDLYYVIKAISGNGSESVESPVALGYTKIPGAPNEVTEVKVNNGRGNVTATEGIEISWKEDEEEGIKYFIYRSSSSSSTLVPLATNVDSSPYKDTQKLLGDTYYYYYVQAYSKDEDDVIKKGPMSDSGPGSEDPAQGFIISPPPAVVVSKKEGDSAHCIIKFTAPIGSAHYLPDGDKTPEDAKVYTYNVYAGSSENALMKVLSGVSSSGESDADGYYSVEVKSDDFYVMTTVFGGKESAQSKIAAPAPYAAQDVIATKGVMVGDYDSYKPGSVSDKKDPGSNSNGVHPVKITWQAPEGSAESSYYVFRSSQRDSGWKRITDSPIKVREFIDKNDAAKPGIIYYYRVLSLNSMGQGTNYSQVDAPVLKENVIDRTQGRGWGYGALSVWQYMKEERKTVESSQKKLTLMHKPNNLDKVGSETINGDISGTLGYRAKVEGFGARITMPYTNYADSWINDDKSLGIYFLFDGDTNTTSNMSANGNMDGIVTCRGMYPGKVRYDKVQIKGGKAGGGTYGVIRDGIDSDYIEVDWKAGEK